MTRFAFTFDDLYIKTRLWRIAVDAVDHTVDGKLAKFHHVRRYYCNLRESSKSSVVQRSKYSKNQVW